MSTLTVGTIKSNTTSPPEVQNSAGTEIGTFCRAWVNFNGSGTVAIRAAFNVSSITDNGTGDYTVNLATAMADANYSVSIAGAASGLGSNLCSRISGTTLSTANSRVLIASGGGSLSDAEIVAVAIFR